MPIYEYKCIECNHIFESIRPASRADDEIACEACKAENAYRILSTFFSPSSSQSSTRRSTGCGGCSGGNCGSCH